jgi:hypothetical protein
MSSATQAGKLKKRAKKNQNMRYTMSDGERQRADNLTPTLKRVGGWKAQIAASVRVAKVRRRNLLEAAKRQYDFGLTEGELRQMAEAYA